MPGKAKESSRLRASEACCALYVARQTTALTIAEIAGEIGVSERTFYRYFPIKAESVGPVFDWTTQTFNETIDTARRDVPIRTVLRDGYRAMLGGDVADRTRALFPLVFADSEMWSVFLRKVHDGERSLAPILAARLGIHAESMAGRTAAAAVASATRISLESMVTAGTDPERVFLEAIDTFSSGTPKGQ